MQLAGGFEIADDQFGLGEDRASVHLLRQPNDGVAGDRFSAENCPVDRCGAAIAGQARSVKIDAAQAREIDD